MNCQDISTISYMISVPYISIVVPVYNVEKYIDECILSLLNQSLTKIEIILVNDGSSDKSGEICDDYAKNDSRVKVFHKVNGGQSSARNLGVKNASGKYILFVDSDDYIIPKTCSVLYSAAEKYGADIVHGDIQNEKSELENPDFRKMKCENRVVSATEFLCDSLESQTYDIVPWLNLIRSEFIKRTDLQFKEGYFYEDQLYNLQMLTLDPNAKVLKLRFPFYFYRMDRQGSTTNLINLSKVSDSVSIINYIYDYCEKNSTCDRELLASVLLISLFQYVRIWLIAKWEVRNAKETFVDEKIFDYALNSKKYNLKLYEVVKSFKKNRYIFTVKNDLRNVISLLMRRVKWLK